MDAKFIAIVERLVKEKGKDTLTDAKKCKAHLADYANNEFKKERHLLMIAIEAGAGKAIATASDLPICKNIQIRSLKDDHFIDENAAAEAIDLLAFALRGDRNKSIASAPSANSQSQSPQTQSPSSQSQSPQPQSPSSQSQSRRSKSAPSYAPPPQPPQFTPKQQYNSPPRNAPRSRKDDINALKWVSAVLFAFPIACTIIGGVIGGIIGGGTGAIVGAVIGFLLFLRAFGSIKGR
jgi:hypothetical protein